MLQSLWQICETQGCKYTENLAIILAQCVFTGNHGMKRVNLLSCHIADDMEERKGDRTGFYLTPSLVLQGKTHGILPIGRSVGVFTLCSVPVRALPCPPLSPFCVPPMISTPVCQWPHSDPDTGSGKWKQIRGMWPMGLSKEDPLAINIPIYPIPICPSPKGHI